MEEKKSGDSNRKLSMTMNRKRRRSNSALLPRTAENEGLGSIEEDSNTGNTYIAEGRCQSVDEPRCRG